MAKNKIKVAWFTDDIDGKARGSSTYSQKLIEQLATNFKDQIDLTLIHRQDKCLHPVCQLTDHITVKTFNLSKFSGMFSWIWYFLSGKDDFDIFHVPRHNLYPFFFISKLRGKIKKFVITLHGAPDNYAPRIYRHGGSWWDWHIKYFAKYFTDKFLAVSQEGEKQIINYYHLNPKKTAYFYISCNNNFHQFSKEEKAIARVRIKEKYGIDQPFFLQVGRFDPHKNVHRLIEAFAILKNKYQLPHKLVLIGGRHITSYDQLVDQTIKKFQLAENVYLAPYVEDEDMPAFYNLCDLYLNFSLNEGFSIPLVEAMKSGAAIITSNISVFPEVAADAAYYLDPFNPSLMAQGIWTILNNQNLKADLVARGFKRAELFNWKKAAELLIQIYQSLLKG